MREQLTVVQNILVQISSQKCLGRTILSWSDVRVSERGCRGITRPSDITCNMYSAHGSAVNYWEIDLLYVH